MNKLKIGALGALVSSALLNVWLLNRPKPAPETQTVEKIVTVDRVVVKTVDKVRTVTRPDGTKIVTETKIHVDETEKSRQVEKHVSTLKTLNKYSLGLEVGRVAGLDVITRPNVYKAQIGYRLWDTPVWTTITAGSDRTVLIGLRIEF